MESKEGLALLERVAVALETIAQKLGDDGKPTPREPMIEQTRKTLLAKHEGQYITVDQARDALGLVDASAKAIGQIVTAAGFERKRWSDGVKFAICEPGGVVVAQHIKLPENIEDAIENARAAKKKNGKQLTPRQVLAGAYLMQGVNAKSSQITDAHCLELKRQYPDDFE